MIQNMDPNWTSFWIPLERTKKTIDGFHSEVTKFLKKIKLQGILNFYLKEVEDDLEIKIFKSLQFHDISPFQKYSILNFWIFTFRDSRKLHETLRQIMQKH